MTEGLRDRIAGAIADISEEWAESAEWLADRIMDRLDDPDALPLADAGAGLRFAESQRYYNAGYAAGQRAHAALPANADQETHA